MAKWIRWWGLGAFVLVVTLVLGVWVFFVDGWVECLIEEAGTKAVGAKVELDGADLSLFPAGLTLIRMQVTDPDSPMTNAVEIASVAMSLDGLHLLRRKVIVEEMVLDGVRLGTPRTTSGAVKPAPEVSPEEAGGMFAFDLPSLEVPDVKRIVEQEDLETLKLIETLKADMQREQDAWNSRLQELPGKAQLAQYKERVKTIKKSAKGGLEGVLGGVGEVQALQQDIESDIASLKNAKKEFEEKVALLRTRIEQIKTSPQRDIQHLKAKYNVSPQGLANITQTLLGGQIGSWVRQGALWYERAKPFLEKAHTLAGSATEPEVQQPLRGKGLDVHFKEANPLPEFLIRLTKVSISLELGDLAGTVHNITPDQPTLGKPTIFMFSGEQLNGVKTVAVEGTLNHVAPAKPNDQLTLRASEYVLKNLVFSKDDRWPVALTSGLGDVRIQAELQGEALTASGSAALHQLRFSAGQEGDANPLTGALSSAVKDISRLNVTAEVHGTLQQYELKLSSDLDRILQQAAGKMINELASEFGGKLQSAISAKIAKPMEDLRKHLSGFEGLAGDLAERVTQRNEILKELLEKNVPTKDLKLPGGLKLPF